MGRGNNDVADEVQTLAAKEAKVASPPPDADATAAAPAEDGPPPSTDEQLAEKDAQIDHLKDKLANHPLDKLKADKAKPPSPPAPAPAAGAIAEEQAVAQLAESDAEVSALFAAQVAKPTKTAPRVTMSTEAAGVPVGAPTYWVDTSANKKIVLKHGPKPKPKADSTTGFKWVGYCIEGCVCATCVAKRAEPSKTEMLDSKRVPKKPSN